MLLLFFFSLQLLFLNFAFFVQSFNFSNFQPGLSPFSNDTTLKNLIVLKEKLDKKWINELGSKFLQLAQMFVISGDIRKEIYDELVERDLIKYIEKDVMCKAQALENMQLNPPSWGLARISQRELPLNESFVYGSTSGKGVDVYVVDTGINLNHEDLDNRASWGKSIGDLPKVDDNGHGTFTAGIIGGQKYGVAKKANLIAVKALDASGVGYTSAVLEALGWIYAHHKKTGKRLSVVNLSLDAPFNRVLNDAIQQASKVGLIIVTAAGNGDENGIPQDACEYSPASSDYSITVGATAQDDAIAHFSNFGKCVTLFAPGVNVVSLAHTDNRSVKELSGTSFAAPHVTGIIAVMISEFQNITAVEVKQKLLEMSTVGKLKRISEFPESPNALLFSGAASNPAYTGGVIVDQEVSMKSGQSKAAASAVGWNIFLFILSALVINL